MRDRPMLSALCVQVLPHGVQVAYVPAQHPIERAVASEQGGRVRSRDPFVRPFRIRKEYLQGLVDPEHVADALEDIPRHASAHVPLPLEERRTRRITE